MSTPTTNASPSSQSESQSLIAHHRVLLAAVYSSVSSPLDPTLFTDTFSWHVPSYLPWGGTGTGIQNFKAQVLDKIAAHLDTTKHEMVSLTIDEKHAVGVVDVRVVGTDKMTRICDMFKFEGEKLAGIEVFYLEPKDVLTKLKGEGWEGELRVVEG